MNHGKCVVGKAAQVEETALSSLDITSGGSGGAHDTVQQRRKEFYGSGARIIGKITICNDV